MDSHLLFLVLAAAVVTFLLRALPFILFSGSRKMPPKVKNVVNALPPAIMGILVIFCLKDPLAKEIFDLLSLFESVISITVVVVLHVLKRNTLLSIFGGTLVYMLLIRLF